MLWLNQTVMRMVPMPERGGPTAIGVENLKKAKGNGDMSAFAIAKKRSVATRG